MENGYTKEEMKMVNETRKIMGDDLIKVSATCVRVPVLSAHSESVSVELEKDISVEMARELFKKAKGIRIYILCHYSLQGKMIVLLVELEKI